MSIADKAQTILGQLKVPIAKITLFAPYIIAGFIGYTVADIVVLSYRPMMLPNEAPPVQPKKNNLSNNTPISGYAAVWDRNLLNEDGKMPPSLSSDSQDDTATERDPVLSQLPLSLLGTIVHFNPDKSIATVQRSGAETKSYIVGEEIANMAKITKVERRRVIFQNLNNRQLEYIEIPDDVAFDFDVKKEASTSAGPIQKTGRNDFVVQRTEIDRLTSNLGELLQQARMEPRFGPDGTVNGFCFVSMQPNTVYQTLGLQVGDCIESVNGKKVDSPQGAMALYNDLKSANNVRLGIERDGRSEENNYDIK